VFFATASYAGAQCLTDAISESNRKYIQDAAGNDMPIGVLVCNWRTSFLFGEMIKIFLEEVLGYHAQIDPTICQNGKQPIYALGGCTNFDKDDLRSCGQESKIHVSLDSWVSPYGSSKYQFKQDYPDLAAVDLGVMGYGAHQGIFLPKAVMDSAYADVGLVLDFYKGYNATSTSGHDPSKYFDKLSDVDPTELALCSEWPDWVRYDDYVQYSGDSAGMTQQADGSYVVKCPDGRWWPGPGCRNDQTKCIPVLTVNGWLLQAIMQWVTAYNFPAAVANSKTIDLFKKHVASTDALHYWWVPDDTFIERQPQQVILPAYSPSGWALGDRKTGVETGKVSKMISSNLQKTRQVREFVSHITFELSEVMAILLEQKQSGATNYSTMCQWIKANQNQAKWRTWAEDPSTCDPQFGIYREEDDVFVTKRNEIGITCRACPSGHFSEELLDEMGRTFVCKACPAGSSLASGGLQCDSCPKGEYQDEEGQSSCKRCDQAKYPDLTGQTQCITTTTTPNPRCTSSLDDISDISRTRRKLGVGIVVSFFLASLFSWRGIL